MSTLKYCKNTTADILSLFGSTNLNLSCKDGQSIEKITQINSAFSVSNFNPAVFRTRKGEVCFEAKLKDLIAPADLERIYQAVKPIYESGVIYQTNLRENADYCYSSIELANLYKIFELVHPENWKVYITIYFMCYHYDNMRLCLQSYVNFKQDESTNYMGAIFWNRNNASSSYYKDFDEPHLISSVDDVKDILSKILCGDLADDIIWSTYHNNVNVDLRCADRDELVASIAHGCGKKSAYIWVANNCLRTGSFTPNHEEDF